MLYACGLILGMLSEKDGVVQLVGQSSGQEMGEIPFPNCCLQANMDKSSWMFGIKQLLDWEWDNPVLVLTPTLSSPISPSAEWSLAWDNYSL